MKQQTHHSPTRAGSVLVIVAGLAALLLTMFLIITRQVRNEVNDGALVARETQARFMLPAALSFILEAGRLGSEFDGEAFGWTDVRDGGIGPRGPRDASGNLPGEVAGGSWPGKGGVYRSPMRAWRRPPGAVHPYHCYNPIVTDPTWLEIYQNADDTESTFLHRALNPQKVDGGMDPKYTQYDHIGELPKSKDGGTKDPKYMWQEGEWPDSDLWLPTEQGLQVHWGAVMDLLMTPEGMRQGTEKEYGDNYAFMLGPQAIADTWSDFASGEKTSGGTPRYRMDSMGRAWFRIYRETEGDHDGDGSPWYDTMRLEDSGNDIHNHGVFIVTCGAGGSEGFRDWSEASASGHFDSEALFDKVRAQERIMWFRVQWSPYVGGGADFVDGRYHVKFSHHGPFNQDGAYSWSSGGDGIELFYSNLTLQRNFWDISENAERVYGRNHNRMPLTNNLGTISWIERLEQEPPVW